MSNIASLNFKKTKADFQVWHNDRTLAPEYLISQKNIELNRTGLEANALRDEIIAKAKSAYIKRTKQRCQAKNYLWSAALNVKANTTMAELENLAKHFKDKYGIQCYQIAIHKDEGYKDENGTHLNNHAHMEFVTLDERGINRQRDFGKRQDGKKILSFIQDDVARLLKMERGVSVKKSKTKRIEPRVWADLKEKEAKRKKILLEQFREVLKEETQKAKNNEALKASEQIALLNKKIALLEQNSKINEEKQIQEQERRKILSWLVSKLEKINENDNEVNAFMFSSNECNSKLMNKVFEQIKALMRAHARNELNRKNRKQIYYQALEAELAECKYALDNSLPNIEFKKQIIDILKGFDYKKIAKVFGDSNFSDVFYDKKEITNYEAEQALATLSKTLNYLRIFCLTLLDSFNEVAQMYNELNGNEKIINIYDTDMAKAIIAIKEISNAYKSDDNVAKLAHSAGSNSSQNAPNSPKPRNF